MNKTLYGPKWQIISKKCAILLLKYGTGQTWQLPFQSGQTKLHTYRQFLISAVRIRTLSDLEDIKASERIWTLSHGVVPLEAMEIPHVPLSQRGIQHHLRPTKCC